MRNTVLSFVNTKDRDSAFKRGVTDSMPFPPGVGGRGAADGNYNVQSYEVITAEKAIDESNVGNRMLRNMGWQEGLVTYLTLELYYTYCFVKLNHLIPQQQQKKESLIS